MAECVDGAPAFGDRGLGLSPLRPGFEIRRDGSNVAGTMGLFLTDDDGHLLVLTAAHVLPLLGEGVVDGGGRAIGTVTWVGPQHIDAALFQVGHGVSCVPGQAGATEVTSIADAVPGQFLTKSGRTTGCTTGRVKRVRHPYRQFTGGHCITIAALDGDENLLTCPGDSGAVWFDERAQAAVALHVAVTDGGEAIGLDLTRVRSYYKARRNADLHLWNGTFEE